MDARHLPLSVWPAAADTETVAACRSGCCVPVSESLARHLVTACTRLGDLVIDLDAADHHIISTALTMGCLATATITDPALAQAIGQTLATTHPDHDLAIADLRLTRPDSPLADLRDLTGAAALVLHSHACPSRRTERADVAERTALDLTGSAKLLKPGGHLVVVTGLHRDQQSLVDPAPALIAQAQRAGLLYLQHIVALRVPVRGEHIESPLTWGVPRAEATAAGVPLSTRAHSDVFIFTRPRITVAPPASGDEGANNPMLGDRAWLEGEL
ncbi:hypothetical protein HCN51_44575 [Nonomuraea sp. FMUSA5-5]|uniref:Methyltransferase domain-containing protein n=1 Tax=Nonomuraea composti TaxID=2720023 RepID=A0ABX1BJE9_9ACTN|nr:hypothetical protein [Nonomuraea sp. FMUSA5-5]NJP96432.1 hypothetical protein [Nonomuraea sp. FMUSA5-5]